MAGAYDEGMEQNPYAASKEAGGRQSTTAQRREIPGCFYVFGFLVAVLIIVGTIIGAFFPE